MKNIAIVLLSFITFSLLESCTKYSNLYEVKPFDNSISENDFFYFENDTVKITYSFWGKKGVMSYTVFNKLNIPIYIDWKKSSLIKNDQKFDYWIDEINTKGKSFNNNRSDYSSLYYGGYNIFNYGTSISESKSIKPERITFLSPKSNVTRVQSNLYNLIPEVISSPCKKEKIIAKNGKKVSVSYIEMSKSNSTFNFRNFITVSTTEKFEKEIYIDNGFYVYRINKLKSWDMIPEAVYNKEKKIDETIMPISSPKMFFIDLKN